VEKFDYGSIEIRSCQEKAYAVEDATE